MVSCLRYVSEAESSAVSLNKFLKFQRMDLLNYLRDGVEML